MYPVNDYRDYLEHHGIMGMKWGIQNGPPYPLGASDHSASEKKAGWRQSLKEKHEARKAQKQIEKEQNAFYKEIKSVRKSVKPSGWNAFDELRRSDKASELQKIKDSADDEVMKYLAKALVSNNQADKDAVNSLCREKADKLLGKAPVTNLYKVTTAGGIATAAANKLGYQEVTILQNDYNRLRKQLDRGKTDYNIPIKKNSGYEEYVRVSKELSAAKKKYENNLKKYSSM